MRAVGCAAHEAEQHAVGRGRRRRGRLGTEAGQPHQQQVVDLVGDGPSTLDVELAQQRLLRRRAGDHCNFLGIAHAQDLAGDIADDLRRLCRAIGFGEGLAQLGRIDRCLLVERDHEVDLALDRGFEVGPADLARARLNLVAHDHRLRARGIRLEPREDADGVAGRGQRHFRHQRHHVHIGQQMREVDQHVARHIDHRHVERLAEFFLQLHERRAVGHQRGVHRRFGRKDRQIVVGADHRAFDEQAVDARRIVDGVDQPATRLQIQRQSAGAEMDVEVEKRRVALTLLAEQPSERRGNRRCADAATRPDHSGQRVFDVE